MHSVFNQGTDYSSLSGVLIGTWAQTFICVGPGPPQFASTRPNRPLPLGLGSKPAKRICERMFYLIEIMDLR